MNQTEENRCFMYSLTQALGHFMESDYQKAVIHLENAKRSAEELNTMQRENEMYKQAKVLLRQIEADKSKRELLRRNYF